MAPTIWLGLAWDEWACSPLLCDGRGQIYVQIENPPLDITDPAQSGCMQGGPGREKLNPVLTLLSSTTEAEDLSWGDLQQSMGEGDSSWKQPSVQSLPPLALQPMRLVAEPLQGGMGLTPCHHSMASGNHRRTRWREEEKKQQHKEETETPRQPQDWKRRRDGRNRKKNGLCV